MVPMFILGAATRDTSVYKVHHESDYMGPQGVCYTNSALIGIEIFIFVNKGWTIKMPDSVPPAVSRSFAAIIPITMVALVKV